VQLGSGSEVDDIRKGRETVNSEVEGCTLLEAVTR
jgi:hypothetical protein